MAKSDAKSSGLRARKQAETRARLTEAALRLFVAKGFDAVTLDEIAAAAGISRRTFFHYFESKEELTFAWLDASTDAMVAAVASQPKNQSLLGMAVNAIAAAAPPLPRDEAFALLRLVNETPALLARSQTKYERLERALADALTERKGLRQGGLKARLAAMTAAGTLRVVSQRWYESGGKEELAVFARRVVKALGAV